jgi:hypothetical protein
MPKIFIGPTILIGVAVIAAIVALFVLSYQGPQEPTRTVAESAMRSEPAQTASAVNVDPMPSPYTAHTFPAFDPSETMTMQSGASAEPPSAPWENSIDQLLNSEAENEKVAAELAALLPSLPTEGRMEAVQHMVNLLEDQQYELAMRLLLDPSLHPDQREVIFTDVLDRPESVKLPALLSLLANPGHPLHEDARRMLRDAVGNDFGSDPAAWEAAVQILVAQEAAEEADANRDVYFEEQ